MKSEIEPAFSPDQWKQITSRPLTNRSLVRERFGDDMPNFPKEWHEFAALALHGQPFGFTHEDLKLLDYAALVMVHSDDYTEGDTDSASELRALSARIAALLPPAEP
jgi:hypothetical protein